MEAPLPLRTAGAALAANPLRTALALIGLVIGVASVITMAALGSGARAAVADDVRSAGTNIIIVRAGNYIRGGDAVNIPSGFGRADTLTPEDAEAIRNIADVAMVSPVVEERTGLVSDAGDSFAQIHGVSAEGPRIYQLRFQDGENFTADDVRERRAVVLLSSPVEAGLFPGRSGVGRTVVIREREFEVVGIYQSSDRKLTEAALVPHTVLVDIVGATICRRLPSPPNGPATPPGWVAAWPTCSASDTN